MKQAETAIASYRTVEPTLAARQALVRQLLREFRDEYGTWPTAKELLRYATAAKAECRHFDPNNIRPRLFELEEQGYAAHGPKRPCSVTGKTAYTWVLTQPVAPPRHAPALERARQVELL